MRLASSCGVRDCCSLPRAYCCVRCPSSVWLARDLTAPPGHPGLARLEQVQTCQVTPHVSPHSRTAPCCTISSKCLCAPLAVCVWLCMRLGIAYAVLTFALGSPVSSCSLCMRFSVPWCVTKVVESCGPHRTHLRARLPPPGLCVRVSSLLLSPSSPSSLLPQYSCHNPSHARAALTVRGLLESLRTMYYYDASDGPEDTPDPQHNFSSQPGVFASQELCLYDIGST